MPTDEEIMAMFPVGARVRSLPEAARSSHTRFNLQREGTVIEHLSGDIHVDWGEDFPGHSLDSYGTHTGHCYFMYVGEIELVSMPNINIDASIPVEIPRLRVSIVRNPQSYNQWTLKVENGPVPTKHEVKDNMDKGIARRMGRLWRQYDLNQLIHRGIDTYGIDPQIFIEAVTQAALAKQAREATGTFERKVYDSELQAAIGSQPALIAIGDQLFSLQPKGAIKGSRAMAMIREKIVKAARVQAKKIKDIADREAITIIRNGERQLAEARKQIDIEKQALANLQPIPQWISENFLKVMRSNSFISPMCVGFEISTKIVAFQLLHTKTIYNDEGGVSGYDTETIRWINSLEHPDSIPRLEVYKTITVWVPFNPNTGIYAYKSCKIMESANAYMFPHISNDRCCMELSGLPAKLTNINEYRKLRDVLNRGSMEVNMESLLTGFNSWHPDIQNQCPKQLKEFIDRGHYHSLTDEPDISFRGAERTPVEVEAKETFNVDSLRESRRARGETLPEITIAQADGLAEVEVTDAVDTEVEEDDNG